MNPLWARGRHSEQRGHLVTKLQSRAVGLTAPVAS